MQRKSFQQVPIIDKEERITNGSAVDAAHFEYLSIRGLRNRRMIFHRFIEDVGVQFRELFFRDVPRRVLLDDLEPIRHQARKVTTVLIRQGALKKQLSQRISEDEKRQTALATRVQIYHHVGDHRNAWRYALELDRLGKTLERQRADLRRAERVYHLQKMHLAHLLDRLSGI